MRRFLVTMVGRAVDKVVGTHVPSTRLVVRLWPVVDTSTHVAAPDPSPRALQW